MANKENIEVSHYYGENVHILLNRYLLTKLAILCQASTIQPQINSIVRELYQQLIMTVVNGEFPFVIKSFNTRMIEYSPFGIWEGEVIDPQTNVVTINIMRAGTLPSSVCFDHLNKILHPKFVRQDHLVVARKLNEQGQVTGAYLGDSKIGGSIEDAILLFPDPMGATGGSMCEVIKYYKNRKLGQAKKIIAINLIVTPEYIKKLNNEHPEVKIYALRLDRGGSTKKVLESPPGLYWEQEIGLTDKQYIIPGGGGFGEIINNSYC
jgi:uracil phosphoribosyltransferase